MALHAVRTYADCHFPRSGRGEQLALGLLTAVNANTGDGYRRRAVFFGGTLDNSFVLLTPRRVLSFGL